MSSFTELYDSAMRDLDGRLSDLVDRGAEFDFDRTGDVLTIEFENGEKFIVSPNSPVEQLWVSANYAGSRFNWSETEKQWVNEKTGETLRLFLNNAISKKLGNAVRL